MLEMPFLRGFEKKRGKIGILTDENKCVTIWCKVGICRGKRQNTKLEKFSVKEELANFMRR